MDIEKNTLTEEQIQDWKKEYGKVYKSIISEEAIIWRKLKRSEYIKIMTTIGETDEDNAKKVYMRQDEIVKICTLYPNNISEIIEENGALSTCIADQVMLKSGFDIDSTVEM